MSGKGDTLELLSQRQMSCVSQAAAAAGFARAPQDLSQSLAWLDDCEAAACDQGQPQGLPWFCVDAGAGEDEPCATEHPSRPRRPSYSRVELPEPVFSSASSAFAATDPQAAENSEQSSSRSTQVMRGAARRTLDALVKSSRRIGCTRFDFFF